MMRAAPLTAEAFAPFGEVLAAPSAAGRQYFERALTNGRPGAWPSLSLTCREPSLPYIVRMERHQFSSQSFVPVDPIRWLVLVAPHATGGGPDMAQAIAFVAGPAQGVTYGADVWHHGLTVLDHPARFAVFMWRDGTGDDEEFVDVAPLVVEVGHV